jgi:hypothetical protein
MWLSPARCFKRLRRSGVPCDRASVSGLRTDHRDIAFWPFASFRVCVFILGRSGHEVTGRVTNFSCDKVRGLLPKSRGPFATWG